MGLLDKLLGIFGSGRAANTDGPLNPGLLNGVIGMIQGQAGGLGDLLKTFREKGMGKIADSWVSVGKNLPISPDQIKSVFSLEQLRALAGQAGGSVDDVAKHLSGMLPHVIDKITPNGTIPEGSSLSSALDMIKGAVLGKQQPQA